LPCLVLSYSGRCTATGSGLADGLADDTADDSYANGVDGDDANGDDGESPMNARLVATLGLFRASEVRGGERGVNEG